MIRIFTPDNVHINKKNFCALFELQDKHLISLESHSELTALKLREGDYSDQLLSSNHIDARYESIQVDEDDVLPEFLNFIIPTAIRNNETTEIEFLKKKYLRHWENCKLVAKFWKAYWANYFEINSYDLIVVFSGCRIYQKMALNLAIEKGIKCFTTEHLFTGNEFFFVENDIAPNNISYIKNINAFKYYWPDAEKILARKNNKNVKSSGVATYIAKDRPVALILGQVVNDYSILCNKTFNKLSAIQVYKDVIKKLAELDIKIVFKAHPYENEKINIRESLTKNALTKYLNDNDLNDRVEIVENVNLELLYEQANWVITICSQSGLEACEWGLKPILLGSAFYDSYGFTETANVNDLIPLIRGNLDGLYLNPDEFLRYRQFLSGLLLGYSCNNKEIEKIYSYLQGGDFTNANIYKEKALVADLVTNNEGKIKAIKTKKETKSTDAKNNIKHPLQSEKMSRRQRLWRKFKKSPKLYLEDSKIGFFRFLGKHLPGKS